MRLLACIITAAAKPKCGIFSPRSRERKSPLDSVRPCPPIRSERRRQSGEILNLLQWFDAAPGDTFFIPAGTVHAIGAGLTLCEIQQNSDVTYRLYDYGRPRELHLDQALAVSHRGVHPARQDSLGDVLVSCDHFVARRHHINGRVRREPSARKFQVLIAIEGSGHIGDQPTAAGDAWYIPPGAPAVDLSGDLILLETSINS